MSDREDADDLNIFDEEAAVDEEHEGQNGEASTNNPEASEFSAVSAPKKRIIKNPRLKFDPDRLCGPRGIPILIDHFKNVKFNGKGHEIEDLDQLLFALEHWTHRLFPSMKFDDSLKQIEKLGRKKPVQVCLQKIRLDMPILANDFISNDNDEDEDIARGDPVDLDNPPTSSAFDDLLEEYRGPTDTSNEAGPSTAAAPSLTDEQKLKIQRNRELAMERRRMKLAATSDAAIEPSTSGISLYDSNHDSAVPDNDEDEDLEHLIAHLKKKRLLSDSEESCDIDDLVDNTMHDEPVGSEKLKEAAIDDGLKDMTKLFKRKIVPSDSEESCGIDFVDNTINDESVRNEKLGEDILHDDLKKVNSKRKRVLSDSEDSCGADESVDKYVDEEFQTKIGNDIHNDDLEHMIKHSKRKRALSDSEEESCNTTNQ